VTALNSQSFDTSYDSADDQGSDTDSTFDNMSLEQTSRKAARKSADGSFSLMDMPLLLEYFEAIPDKLKPYMMHQLLRRCPKPTLHFVADVVNPTLKCDFLAQLPLELGLNVIKFLDVQSLCRASQVSKKWRQVINSDEKTWKMHFDAANFVLPDGELERAIEEGWGWQYNGDQDYEIDLRSSAMLNPDILHSSLPASPIIPGISDGNDAQSAVNAASRSLKRKAAMLKLCSRKVAKRKGITNSQGRDIELPEWWSDSTVADSPYAAASAAAVAVPFPNVGLPSLRSLHLYKSLYQRHHHIQQNWMRQDIQPLHFAFHAHDRHVVTCLQFDSNKILTGSDDTNINVYDTKTGALRATLEGHEGGVWALQYHQNTLVSGSTDRTVRVWDIERAKCTQIFQGHTSTVRCLQILLPTEVGKTPDGKPRMLPVEPLIITGSRDSTLRIWKLPRPDDAEYFQGLPPQDDSLNPYFVRALTGHSHSVRAIAAHGDTLVSGSYDCTVRVWKISTGEAVHRLQGHSYKVYSVVLDHKRNRCMSGSMDNLVKIWSLETGSVLYNLEGHQSLVGLLDLQDDRLVSAAADSTLRIWDPENGRCKAILTAHTGAITCFQHDGQKVISGSDRTLKMWDVRTGECLRDLLTDLSGVWQVKFSDRRCVAAVQRERLTYIEVKFSRRG
jgi:F-box and WD-40 domain protein CDC4